MIHRAFLIRVTICCLFLILAYDLSAQTQNVEQQLIAFYNVENLFDTINNPATADEDMLPLADRAWSSERYERKIDLLARVVADMQCCGQPPAIVALAEVENRQVLESLTSHPNLCGAEYQICHSDSPDRRGIDVALLYRPELFRVAGVKTFPIKIAQQQKFRTRDILAAWGEFCGEKFIFVVVHWPSRIGGVEATEPLRIECAREVRRIVDSVASQSPNMKIVVMGDMNDNPSNRSLRKILCARRNVKCLQRGELYNPFARKTAIGSSRYDGRWNHFDNIILSANLVDDLFDGLKFNSKTPKKQSAYVFRRDYMCDVNGYPVPTYRGVEYVGGASDHLPVCLILER